MKSFFLGAAGATVMLLIAALFFTVATDTKRELTTNNSYSLSIEIPRPTSSSERMFPADEYDAPKAQPRHYATVEGDLYEAIPLMGGSFFKTYGMQHALFYPGDTQQSSAEPAMAKPGDLLMVTGILPDGSIEVGFAAEGFLYHVERKADGNTETIAESMEDTPNLIEAYREADPGSDIFYEIATGESPFEDPKQLGTAGLTAMLMQE